VSQRSTVTGNTAVGVTGLGGTKPSFMRSAPSYCRVLPTPASGPASRIRSWSTACHRRAGQPGRRRSAEGHDVDPDRDESNE